jgi:hypothetical protein
MRKGVIKLNDNFCWYPSIILYPLYPFIYRSIKMSSLSPLQNYSTIINEVLVDENKLLNELLRKKENEILELKKHIRRLEEKTALPLQLENEEDDDDVCKSIPIPRDRRETYKIPIDGPICLCDKNDCSYCANFRRKEYGEK